MPRVGKIGMPLTGFLTIGEDKIRLSQLPEVVVTPEGFELRRPEHWAEVQLL